MTNQEFRQQFKKKQDTLRALVDIHYEALCTIAQEFHKEMESFRIETIYGDFTFIPKHKLK